MATFVLTARENPQKMSLNSVCNVEVESIQSDSLESPRNFLPCTNVIILVDPLQFSTTEPQFHNLLAEERPFYLIACFKSVTSVASVEKWIS